MDKHHEIQVNKANQIFSMFSGFFAYHNKGPVIALYKRQSGQLTLPSWKYLDNLEFGREFSVRKFAYKFQKQFSWKLPDKFPLNFTWSSSTFGPTC